VKGEGADSLPTDSRNIIFKTIGTVFKKAKRNVPTLELQCLNRIPLERGLGSSSSAFLLGLLAANRLLKNRFSAEQILDWATELEGHPDNVAPALLGGVRASGVFGGRVVSAALPFPKARMVVAVPDFTLSTKKARAVLPKSVPLKDAVQNLSAVALLPWAFSSSPSMLGWLLNDGLHEPYRAPLIPGFYGVKKAALAAGAHGVILSGAGPTMLSFVRPGKAAAVSAAMKQAFKRAGVKAEAREVEIDKRGAIVR
jgi:homoserine kinase